MASLDLLIGDDAVDEAPPPLLRVRSYSVVSSALPKRSSLTVRALEEPALGAPPSLSEQRSPRRSVQIVIERRRTHDVARMEITLSSLLLRMLVLLLCLSSASALAAVPAAPIIRPVSISRSALHLQVSPTIMPSDEASSPAAPLLLALSAVAESGRAQLARQVLGSWHSASGGLAEQTASLACRALFPVYHRAVCSWHAARSEWAAHELSATQRHIAEALGGGGRAYRMEGRIKSALSLFEKSVLRRKQVADMLGLRIVVPDDLGEAECYRVAGAIVESWGGEGVTSVKDYVSAPKKNGYQSLHLLVQTAQGARIEVQIRTESMHHTAVHGSASHAEYKALAATDERLVFAAA